MRLHIHLPNEQSVIFDPTADDVQETSNASTSTLLQWFLLNERDVTARNIPYSRIPEHYVWVNRTWQRRSTAAMSVGRTYSVSHHNQELFALRRLLDVVTGATGWNDLLSVEGHTYPTFHAACGARGMLADDADVIAALQLIVATNCSVSCIRREFALLLQHRVCQSAVTLFNMFAESMCDDGNASRNNCERALMAIEDIMQEAGRSLGDVGFDLPNVCDDDRSYSLQDQFYDEQLCIRERDAIICDFTEEQQAAMDECCRLVNAEESGLSVRCIMSSGGTGKSKFVNGVTWHLRSEGKIVLNVAASALAASVLIGGRTAHSCFGIPVPCTSGSFCSLKPRERHLIKLSSIIFYDEMSMVSTDIANTVDRTLREIMQRDVPFGGKPFIFLGDFKQLLPVIPGSKADNTVKNCDWWPHAKVFKFTHNFRAHLNPDYARFLDDVGNGRIADVPVPDSSLTDSMQTLVHRVYGDNMADVPRTKNLILALTLEACNQINNYCLERLAGATLFANEIVQHLERTQRQMHSHSAQRISNKN
jgi:ATP-dependent DNA helicase PIF1